MLRSIAPGIQKSRTYLTGGSALPSDDCADLQDCQNLSLSSQD